MKQAMKYCKCLVLFLFLFLVLFLLLRRKRTYFFFLNLKGVPLYGFTRGAVEYV